MKNRMIVAAMLGMLCNGIAQAAPKSITIVPTKKLVHEELLDPDSGKSLGTVAGVHLTWINRNGETMADSGYQRPYYRKFNEKINISDERGVLIEAVDAKGTLVFVHPAEVMWNGTYYDGKDCDITYEIGYSGYADINLSC